MKMRIGAGDDACPPAAKHMAKAPISTLGIRILLSFALFRIMQARPTCGNTVRYFATIFPICKHCLYISGHARRMI
jgi:hypothetical protein